MKKTIGILGGMGPLATADLYRKITLLEELATLKKGKLVNFFARAILRSALQAG